MVCGGVPVELRGEVQAVIREVAGGQVEVLRVGLPLPQALVLLCILFLLFVLVLGVAGVVQALVRLQELGPGHGGTRNVLLLPGARASVHIVREEGIAIPEALGEAEGPGEEGDAVGFDLSLQDAQVQATRPGFGPADRGQDFRPLLGHHLDVDPTYQCGDRLDVDRVRDRETFVDVQVGGVEGVALPLP